MKHFAEVIFGASLFAVFLVGVGVGSWANQCDREHADPFKVPCVWYIPEEVVEGLDEQARWVWTPEGSCEPVSRLVNKWTSAPPSHVLPDFDCWFSTNGFRGASPECLQRLYCQAEKFVEMNKRHAYAGCNGERGEDGGDDPPDTQEPRIGMVFPEGSQ